MKKREILAMLLLFAIFAVFALNLSGRSVHVYLNVGEKDLVWGASSGVSHHAWADHFEPANLDLLVEAPSVKDVHLGPLSMLIERPGQFYWMRFHANFKDPEYRSLEFPWLLWLIVPALLLMGRRTCK